VGIVKVNIQDGCKFYSLLKDDYTEFTDAKFSKKKSDAANQVFEFCVKIKTQSEHPENILRKDSREYR
jgi:hypothetical protein